MHNIHSWFLAARPKTLTAAIVPFAAGAALSYRNEGILSWTILLLCLACALLIQVATNFINDALDFKRGGDTDQRLGPTRVCHAGLLSTTEVLRAGIGCLLFSAVLGIPLAMRGGPELSVLFGASLLCGYAYTGGSYSISMNGLGELFTLLFFGIVATTASFYLQAQHWSVSSAILGIQIGLLAAAIASINNLRDIVEDGLTGKRTLAVKFGAAFARALIAALLITPYFIGVYWLKAGLVYSTVLPLAALPLAIALIYKIYTTEPSADYNKFLALSALHHLLFGAAFIVGLWL